MTLESRRTLRSAGTAVAWLMGVTLAGGQAAPQQKPQLAEEAFKNVQVLKGIPVNEFMGTMGVFSATLGMSCEDCHSASDRDWGQYAIDNNRKRTARRMVTMVAGINKDSFGGRQVVTCYTCHRGGNRPLVTASLAALYGASTADEPDDVVAAAPGTPPAEPILDR